MERNAWRGASLRKRCACWVTSEDEFTVFFGVATEFVFAKGCCAGRAASCGHPAIPADPIKSVTITNGLVPNMAASRACALQGEEWQASDRKLSLCRQWD